MKKKMYNLIFQKLSNVIKKIENELEENKVTNSHLNEQLERQKKQLELFNSDVKEITEKKYINIY